MKSTTQSEYILIHESLWKHWLINPSTPWGLLSRPYNALTVGFSILTVRGAIAYLQATTVFGRKYTSKAVKRLTYEAHNNKGELEAQTMFFWKYIKFI